MRELQQKQKLKRRLYSIPVLLVLAFLVVLSIKGTLNVMEKRRESIEHVEELETKASELKKRQADLEVDINYLSTEEGIDEEIKERFNVSRPGEQVVIIVDPKPVATSTEENKGSWYKRIWSAIINFL